ncbi:hypothetical protein EV1_046795 [Malus domestica]
MSSQNPTHLRLLPHSSSTRSATPRPSPLMIRIPSSPIAIALTNLASPTTHRIELPNGKLGIDYRILLKWKADFESNLDNCVILASSVIHQGPTKASLFSETGFNGLCTTNLVLKDVDG